MHQDSSQVHEELSRPRRIGRYYADDIHKCIFLNENYCVMICICLKFVPSGPFGQKGPNRPGNGLAPKPLLGLMMANSIEVYTRQTA